MNPLAQELETAYRAPGAFAHEFREELLIRAAKRIRELEALVDMAEERNRLLEDEIGDEGSRW